MNITSMNDTNLSKAFITLATMKRINSAKDDAAGLVIAEGLKSLSTGYEKGTENAAIAQNMNNTAEGGLNSIKENLQRIRELSVQASNGIYTDGDRAAIQDEINQLKEGIQDAAKGTEFNTKKLLDGSTGALNIASGPDGKGNSIMFENSTLETLGIKDFDVTKEFNISDIDEALSKVTSSMSKIGASNNRLDHTINYNNSANESLVMALSKIEDLDAAKAISDMKKESLLQNYRMFAQTAQMQNNANVLNRMFM